MIMIFIAINSVDIADMPINNIFLFEVEIIECFPAIASVLAELVPTKLSLCTDTPKFLCSLGVCKAIKVVVMFRLRQGSFRLRLFRDGCSESRR